MGGFPGDARSVDPGANHQDVEVGVGELPQIASHGRQCYQVDETAGDAGPAAARVFASGRRRQLAGRSGGSQGWVPGVTGEAGEGGGCSITLRDFRFSFDARTRNFTYGTTCLMAATFIWQGLRQDGQL